jgi:hypothetical protein
MAEKRVVSTRHYRSDPSALHGKTSMANGIDGKVDTVQPSARESVLDCADAKTERNELASSNDAMLPRRQLRDRPVTWAL